MKPINWMADKIISSVTTLIGGVVISKVESESLKSQVKMLSELEDAALNYEQEGKPQLAQLVRDRISILSSAGPGNAAATVAESLAQNNISFGEVAPTVSQPKKIGTDTTEKRRRGRPRKTDSTEATN
jgi:uncharacterized protein YqeY